MRRKQENNAEAEQTKNADEKKKTNKSINILVV